MAGRGAAPALYPRDWRDPEAFRARADDVLARFDREARERAAAAVRTPSDGAAGKLERLVADGGLFVATGQQPGLFGGPLYSLYKGLTAARLASTLEALLDRPVLPLFWVASEDHDWDEAHETWLADLENDLRHFTVERPEGVGDEALHRIPVGAPLEDAREAFLDALPDTDFSGPYRELLERAWTADATLADGFLATVEGLLGPSGVAFTTADDPALKEASVPVLRRALEGAREHEEALTARARELEEAGYHVQVHVMEGGVNLFVEGPAGRERLYRDDGSFHLRHSEKRLGRDDLESLLADEPGKVSPNVLLRPVVEDAVFPTVAYVAGPGEIAYYAQLAPLYEAHGVTIPVTYPRFSVTAVESKVGKVLDKFDLELDDLDRPFHEVAGDVARDEVPPGARRVLGELRGAVGQKTSALQDETRDLDPTLKGPISHARSVIFDALGDVEKKIVQAAKRESEIALQQIEKAQLHLFPEGKPQERRMNPFYYLFRYGDRFLRELSERFDTSLPSSPKEG